MILLTEIPLPRIVRQGTACPISARGQARKARIAKFELDEGSQPYHLPFPNVVPQGPPRGRALPARGRLLPPRSVI